MILRDLFIDGYEKKILFLIKEYFSTEGICMGNKPWIKEVAGNEDFTIDKVNINIHYDRYEAFPGFCGSQSAIIPLKKIKHLVNPNGPLNYLR